MTAASFILFLGTTDWQIARVEGDAITFTQVAVAAGASPAQVAGQVAAALQTAGHDGQRTILALPSSWCLAASISIADLPRNDRKPMIYRLEEKLPLAAEELIADFILPPREQAGGEGGSALGVCVKISQVLPIVLALESAGVRVQSISPAALLAAAELNRAARAGSIKSPGDFRIILLGEREGEMPQVSLIACEAETPVSWALLPATAAEVKLHLDLQSIEAQAAGSVDAFELDRGLVDALPGAAGMIVNGGGESVAALAARFAARVADGREKPFVEFRRGPLAMEDSLSLHRRPLNLVLAAAVALLLVCTGIMLLRGQRYEQIHRSAQRQMNDAFRERFPGWAVPANVKAIVESEHRKLAGRNGSSLPPEAARSALFILRDVAGNLPADARFSIVRLGIDQSTFDMEGRVRSYEDVDAIAAAVRKSGLMVQQPQARREGDGYWSFTLHGSRPADSTPPNKGAAG